MIVGILGDLVFQTSTYTVKTLSNISRVIKPRIARHEIIGSKPKLEYQGMDLEEFTFDIRLDASLGVDPTREIDNLALMAAGFSHRLIIGNVYYGNFMITNIGQDIKYTYRNGVTIAADLLISLTEYIDD